MKGISLQSDTLPENYSLTATFEGLLALERYGFYICRRGGEGNGEFFTAMRSAKLQQMWQSLQAITRDRLWDDHRAHFAVWDASYLLTATGHIPHIASSSNLAGVVIPENRPLQDTADGTVRWYFQVGLDRSRSRLPLAARELVALSEQGVGQEWHRFYQTWKGTLAGTYPIQRVYYRYIHQGGNVFTCIADTLDEARAKRDNWLNDGWIQNSGIPDEPVGLYRNIAAC